MTMTRSAWMLALTLPFMSRADQPPPQGGSPLSHPRLLADSSDIVRAREWTKLSPWYRSLVLEHKEEVDAFIARRPIYVSPIKQTYQYKMYSCPVHDVELLYEESSPFRHRCPRDTSEAFSGGKYDASWAGWYNREVASRLVWMGILYQLEGDERYADAGKEILLTFASYYLKYPTDNTILGPAHVFFGTLSESFWGVDMAYGYDLLYNYKGFSDADRLVLKDQLFMPLARITQRFPESASNRQLWYNCVSAAVGFMYGDKELIDFALKGKYGFEWQIGSALPESGFWPEWSGYHFVALRGMIHLAEMARHNGLDLYRMKRAGRTMKDMFDVPFDIILPNYEFPRSKDSGGGNLLEYASFYEIGYAVYRDRRYLSLLNMTGKNRGTQVAGETSALGRSKAPITMFNLVPDLAEDTTALYTGQSVDIKGNGFAILRNGTGSDRRYLYLDYGIMGGEHGHPDRLQIGYYARGRNWIIDPLNETYFNPNLQLWYRQTIAHNTLVVDQTSQTWANGKRVFFGALPALQIGSGSSETVYPGSDLTRTVIQAGDYAIDLFDVAGNEPRILDWPLHAFGHVTVTGVAMQAEPPSLFGPEPRFPGYDQLKEVQSGTTDRGWSAVFEDTDGEKLAVIGIGEPGTKIFAARTPPLGGFYKQMVIDRSPLPMVFSRRMTKETRFAHLIHAFGNTQRVISFTKGESPSSYKIVHAEGTDIVTADSRKGEYRLLRRLKGKIALLSGFNITSVRDGDQQLLSSPSLLEAIECRWNGAVLEVDTHQPLIGTRVWGPGITRLVLNGSETALHRQGDFVVVQSSHEPFLEVLSPQDSNLVAGARNIVRVRVWNPTDTPLRGALKIAPSDDSGEIVRSQLDWWGGVVNLRALNKGSIQRMIRPARFRDDQKTMSFTSGAQVTIAPGASKAVDAEFTLPSDTPPTDHKLIIGFGGISITKSFTVEPPVTINVLIPNGAKETLSVDLRNTTRVTRKIRIALGSSPGWEISGGRTKTVTLVGLGRTRVNFTARLLGPWTPAQYYPVNVDVSTGDYSTTVQRDLYVALALRADVPPSLDGSWHGWEAACPVMIDSSIQISKLLLGNQPWKGRQDLSARVRIMYDSSYLYVGAEVADDSVVTHWNFPMMSYPWDTDCMEVVLDTRRTSSQGSDPPTPGLFRHLSLAEHTRTEFGAELWRGGGAGGPLLPKPLLVQGAETFFHRTPNGYTLVCRYPWKGLNIPVPARGTKLGFDIAFSDNDGTTYRKNQHIWAGYGQNQSWWDLGTIGVLLFEP